MSKWSKWSKFKNLCFDVFGYVFMILFCGMCLVVPTAIVVWGIRWILVMTGVLG